MRQLARAIKHRVKQWQGIARMLGELVMVLVSSFFAVSIALILRVLMPLSVMILLFVPLVVAAIILLVAKWNILILKPLHPLVRQLGSHDEGKRKEALEQLLQMGDEAIPLLIRALNAPSEIAPSGDWCGFYAHRLAIEGLGRLKAKECTKVLVDALKHEDAGVKANAAWALGEIGAKEAVPELIPLLFYRAKMTDQENIEHEESVRRSAREALRKLGEGELVETFLQVLSQERNEGAIERLRCWLPQYRAAIIRALLNAVRGGNVFEASQAAWALGKLNAVEALPVLERLAFSFRTPRTLRQYCQGAVSWLRTIATLPTPANLTHISTENLPTIPDPDAFPTDTLPSPASPTEEND